MLAARRDDDGGDDIYLKIIDIFVLATDAIHWNKFENAKQYSSTNAHSYKVVIYWQKLHHFCNTSSPVDGPELGRKYLGNN